MRSRVVIAIVLALTFGAACSDGDDKEPAKAGSTSVTTAASAKEEDAAKVELISAGAEPRTVLRLRPVAGSDQRVRMRQKLTQRVSLGGQNQSVDSPPNEFDLRNHVVSVADGRIETEQIYESARVVEEPGANPDVVAQMRAVIDKMSGAKGRAVYDDRGRILDFAAPNLKIEGAPAQLTEQLVTGLGDQAASLALPLPAEAVGVGAKWRVTTSPKFGGLRMNVVSDLTLTQVTAGMAVATISQTLTFVPGEIELGGTEATVESGQLAGTGTIRWDLSGVQPLMDQTIEGTAVMRIGEGAQAQRAEQHQKQVLTVVAR